MSSRRLVVPLVLALVALLLPTTAAVSATADAGPPPLLTTQETIGTSVQGRPIVAIHRTRQSGDGTTGARRTLLVVGNVHGDEQAGLRVVRLLRLRTDLPANLDLWLVPTANPDGTAARTRTNAHGVDLNRNFPYRWGRGPKGPTWGGPAPWSEPESRALRDLVLRVQPDLMVVFHQPLFGVGASDKGPAIARAIARGMALPVQNFVCTGVCHGTFGSWLDHATPGLAVIAEFGHRVRSWRIGRAAATVVQVAAGGPSTTAFASSPYAGQSAARTAGWWHPGRVTSWQIQLQGTVRPDSPSFAAQVVEVDGNDTPVATLRRLHARGARVLCYLDAGSWENWRPDAKAFPAAVLGKALDGWPGERWLDIRRLGVLRPLLAKRVARCKAKGFDGVDYDNVEGYANDSGFPLTGAQQLAFNRMLAHLAHRQGLAVALKNDLGQIPALVRTFDLAVNESCVTYQECRALVPFIDAGKPVLHIEYDLTPPQFCPVTEPLGITSIGKLLDLKGPRTTCP